MPIRTDADAVNEIRQQEGEEPVADLTPFIETSSALVDELCTHSGYDDARLELIERWLAAHFYSILDPQRVREEVSTLREVYQQEVKVGLAQTRYGQMAMVIDTAGNLAKLNDKVLNPSKFGKPSAAWLGTDC